MKSIQLPKLDDKYRWPRSYDGLTYDFFDGDSHTLKIVKYFKIRRHDTLRCCQDVHLTCLL